MKSSFLINVADGRGLIEALAEAQASAQGWWQAQGFVEEVELRVASESADRRQTFSGRYALVSLLGPSGGPFMALLSRQAGGTSETVGGELLSARSASVTALFVPAKSAAADETFGEEPVTQPAAIETRSKGSSWALKAALAAGAKDNDDEEGEPGRPERGDFVHHFAFGWCEVVQAVGDRLKIRDLAGGRVREVVIDVLQISPPGEKDGKRAFKLTRKT